MSDVQPEPIEPEVAEEPVEAVAEAPEPEAPDTAEEPAAAAAEGGEAEPEAKKRAPWWDARIATETAKRKEAITRAEELAAENERLRAQLNGDEPAAPETGEWTTERVRQEAQKIADKQLAEDRLARAIEKTNEAANRVFQAGVAAHPDFDEVRANLVTNLGDQITNAFVEAITTLPNGHDVFHALGKDLDHAAEVLALPPIKMAVELARMGADLATPKGRAVSAAPAPLRPIGGVAKGGPDIYDGNIADEDFYALREKQRKAAYEARR